MVTKTFIAIVGGWAIFVHIACISPVFSETDVAIDNHNQSPASFFVRFYQRFISVFDGDNCPMYPSCSQYSLQCIKKHGFWLGWIMTCDRLLHEPDEMNLAPLIIMRGKTLAYDPVHSNDQWWYKYKKEQ